MAVMTAPQYISLSDLYANAQVQVAGVATYYFDAAYEIVALNAFDPEIDLLIPFYNAYLAAETAYANPPQSTISAVRKLQEHVLKRAVATGGGAVAAGTAFTDINQYYADIPDKFADRLLDEFAALSLQAGFTINAAHTES